MRNDAKSGVEIRCYISSLENNAQLALLAACAHCDIENSLHWVLDIAFRKDESRMRKGNRPENFAIVRHIAHELLKQDRNEKIGIKAKRFKVACDRNYLPNVFFV